MTQSAPTALSGSLKPLQRFACKSCKSSFTYGRNKARTRAKFADDVVLEAVRVYIQGLTSYRGHAEQWGQAQQMSPDAALSLCSAAFSLLPR